MRFTPFIAGSTVAIIGSTSGFATEYLTVSQAQQAIFPGAAFTDAAVRLTPAQVKIVSEKSGVRLRSPDIHAWRTDTGGWFFVDEVLGKHEFITYAVGLDAKGAVCGVEILVYKESYGQQVRNPQWRAQFAGKTALSPLKLDKDIKNISGATLSSRHVMEGVKRILAIHETAFAHS
ncbi:MAG TPA: FMN-binding protein [Rariglobus sp.]|jgi:hypothetical protein|nr:FMN-binding protein [Rariglobus sp.]